MKVSDDWLVERAHKLKAARARANKAGAPQAKSLPPLDDLWKQLQQETTRQARVYVEAAGDANAVNIKTSPNQIEVSVPDGRRTVLTVDLKRRTLVESFRNAAGAVRIRRPIIAFAVDADGNPTFNFGGLPGAAGSLLRRMI